MKGKIDMYDEDFLAIIGLLTIFVVFIIAISLVDYILTGIAYMKLAKQRGIKNPWLAWIPFANAYLIGKVSDDINAQYQKKTNRGVALLILNIISSAGGLITSGFAFDAFNRLARMSDYFTSSYSYSFGYAASSVIIIVSLLLAAASIWCTVILFMSYYSVFKEYSPANAGAFLAISLVALFILSISFAAPIIILCIYKNTPQFTVLNTRSSYYNPNANPYQQGYQQQQFYNQPYQQRPYQQSNNNQHTNQQYQQPNYNQNANQHQQPNYNQNSSQQHQQPYQQPNPQPQQTQQPQQQTNNDTDNKGKYDDGIKKD